MKDRFYVRLTNDEQVDAFVNEFVRTGLLRIKKQLLENQGKTLKEIMIQNGTWESFSGSTMEFGKDPDEEVKKLEEKARNDLED